MKLKTASVYLAGPIEHSKDYGVGWRQEFKDLCRKKNIDLKYLDPTNKPLGVNQSIRLEQDGISQLRQDRKWNELSDRAKKIRRYDLRCIDHSHFVVAYVDTDIHLCGSYDEIFSVEDQQKPLFIIVKGGKDKCPLWLFAVVDHQFIFSSVNECVDYLEMLNKGQVPLSSRWVLEV